MKTKNSDIAVKIFLVVVAVILVGLLIAWSTGVFKDKRNDLNDGTERINKAISSMAEFDLLAYDGGNITGNLLVDLINEVVEGEMDIEEITVETIKGTDKTYTNSAKYNLGDLDKQNADYINPNGVFKGKIKRNENGIIETIKFTQQ